MFYKLKFWINLQIIKTVGQRWSWRGLRLIGKVQIIKSFALTKVLNRLTLILSNKEFIKKINTLLSLVWKSKDKVKSNKSN